jgi:hypothetical protein
MSLWHRDLAKIQKVSKIISSLLEYFTAYVVDEEVIS